MAMKKRSSIIAEFALVCISIIETIQLKYQTPISLATPWFRIQLIKALSSFVNDCHNELPESRDFLAYWNFYKVQFTLLNKILNLGIKVIYFLIKRL